MKVLVAHPQGQHSFRLVHALVAAGYNVTYMTTVYDRPGSLTHAFMRFIRGDDRRRAEGRRMPEFDDSYVVQRYEFLGLLSLLLFKLDRSRVWYRRLNRWIDEHFGRKVADKARRDGLDAVVCYDKHASAAFGAITWDAYDRHVAEVFGRIVTERG